MNIDKSIGPTDTFQISFNTTEMPGMIVCVEVTIKNRISKDKNDTFRVDLANHPLYPALEQYVLANPSGKRKGK